MPALGTGNRAMFWRIVCRLLGANRGRAFVILLALGASAAVSHEYALRTQRLNYL